MSRFATFAVLYMTAMLLELAEHWRHPRMTVATLALVLAVLWTGVTRRGFLVFLAAVTGYFLVALFPDVANHVNVAIYCNVLMLTGIGYTLLRPLEFPTDDAAFELLRPVLQTSMILVYALAGFAKLNTDFLDPDVSCVGSMVGDLAKLRRSTVEGIPTLPLLFVAGALAGDRLVASRAHWQPWSWVRLFVIGLGMGAVLLAVTRTPGVSASVSYVIVFGMALLVIVWELVGGLLLAVPALQAPVLAFSWSMHATLALIGFVDFGALALALLLTFLPRTWFEETRRPVFLPGLGWSLPRHLVYFAICLVAGFFSAIGHRLPAGLALNLAALVLVWPVLQAAAAPTRRLAWRGVPLGNGVTPAWMFLFPLLLVLHGLTSYLGLRTAGNFTMFSNLRTEARSNHLLLGGNFLKLWSYQEDAVRFVRIDDRQAAIGYNYQPLEGNRLPVVEFRKLILLWTRTGRAVPMTIEYQGRVLATEDITREPEWRTSGRDWEMRLMDFRVIQGDGANRCRW